MVSEEVHFYTRPMVFFLVLVLTEIQIKEVIVLQLCCSFCS